MHATQNYRPPPPLQSRLSIKGLLIFILYVNNIFMSLDNETSIHMYADDTLLVCKADR